MRIGVIADIHGNYRALQAVLADIRHQDTDSIVSLGDNIGYGPEPEEVVTAIIDRAIVSILGNHELALAEPDYFRKLNPTCQESLEITKRLLSPSSMNWLTARPFVRIEHDGRFIHGSPPNSTTTYLYNVTHKQLARLFDGFSEFVCFAGHTHTLDLFVNRPGGEIIKRQAVPSVVKLDRKCRYIIIPGSVGQPRDMISNEAKYGIWDVDACTFEFRSVPYSVAETVQLLQERGFPPANARRLQW